MTIAQTSEETVFATLARTGHWRSTTAVAKATGFTQKGTLLLLLALEEAGRIKRNCNGAWRVPPPPKPRPAPAPRPSRARIDRATKAEVDLATQEEEWRWLAEWLDDHYVLARPKATLVGERALLAVALDEVGYSGADRFALCRLLWPDPWKQPPRSQDPRDINGYGAQRLQWVLLSLRQQEWGEAYQGDRPAATPGRETIPVAEDRERCPRGRVSREHMTRLRAWKERL